MPLKSGWGLPSPSPSTPRSSGRGDGRRHDLVCDDDVVHSHPQAADRHLLDVFTPESGSGTRPVLIYVHGGAFVGGNKRLPNSPFYDNIMLWAVKNGFVGVNTTYRLAPASPWPAGFRRSAAE